MKKIRFLLATLSVLLTFTTHASSDANVADEEERLIEERFQSFKTSLLQKTTSEAQKNNLKSLLDIVFPSYWFTRIGKFDFRYREYSAKNLLDDTLNPHCLLNTYFESLLLQAAQLDLSQKSSEFFVDPKYFTRAAPIREKNEGKKCYSLVDQKKYNNIWKRTGYGGHGISEIFTNAMYPVDKSSADYQRLRFFLANIASFGFLCKDKWDTRVVFPNYGGVSGWEYQHVSYKRNEFKQYLEDLSTLPASFIEVIVENQNNKQRHAQAVEEAKRIQKELSVIIPKKIEELRGLQQQVEDQYATSANMQLFFTLKKQYETAHTELQKLKEQYDFAHWEIQNKNPQQAYARRNLEIQEGARKFPLIIEMITDGTVRFFADQEIRKKKSFLFKRMFLKMSTYFSDNPLIKMATWWKDLINQLPEDNICRPSLQKTYAEYFGGDDRESQRNSTFEQSLHEWLGSDFTPQEIDKMIAELRSLISKGKVGE